jgi:hypothetical protein
MGDNYLFIYQPDLRAAWVIYLLSQQYFKDTSPYAGLRQEVGPSQDLGKLLERGHQHLSNYNRVYLLVGAAKLRMHSEGITTLISDLPIRLTLLVAPTYPWVAEELFDDVYLVRGLAERLKILTKDQLMIEGTTFYSSFLSHVCYAEEALEFDRFVSDHFLNKNRDLRSLLGKLASVVEESLTRVGKERQYSKILGGWGQQWERAESGVEFPVVGTFPVVADLFNDALWEEAIVVDQVRGIVEDICRLFIDNLTDEQIKSSRLYESFRQYESQLRASGVGTEPSDSL